MSAKVIVLAVTLAVCHAGPVWINGNEFIPGAMVVRIGRSPNMVYSYGSALSTNMDGIRHSTSIGSSFRSDDEAYGSHVAVTNKGAFARGIGVASAARSLYPLGHQRAAASAYNGLGRNAFGSALSTSRNYGGHYSSAVSSAQTGNGLQYSSAMSSTKNGGLRGLGYDSSVATAQSNSGLGYGSALASAQRNNGFKAAVSAGQNIGGYEGSMAQVIQHRTGSVQHSRASSINGPRLQVSQSHAFNSGFL